MSNNFKIQVIDNTTNNKFQNLESQIKYMLEFINSNPTLEKLIIFSDSKINSSSKSIFSVDLSNKDFIDMFKDLNITVEIINKGYKCSYVNSYGIKFFSTFYTKSINEMVLNTALIKDLCGGN
jgi:hypothetical protein